MAEVALSDVERLGTFYLGRVLEGDPPAPASPLLYDSRHLTTHAVCVGMTGSGKTGLCLGLLEEAALDAIPAIAIDPKGDLGNLLLTFPGLPPESLEGWIDPEEAARAGRSPAEHAAALAERWRRGLAEDGQDLARIERFAAAVERTIFTPGSRAGQPLAVLRRLAPPAAGLDEEGRRERLTSSVSGLLALVGLDADPLRSREHMLLSAIVGHAWAQGREVALADLVREVVTPPVPRVGVLDVESFYPARERFELATRLNAPLAAPSFAAWLEGHPLDARSLLWTDAGRPRLSVVSIAHLSDEERMFVVTLLLAELVGWMRTQPGTSSLRALLFIDEVFGYLPPTAMPASKLPLLTLLKQARAFGLGVVLATQNPADLDYKALSNAGTWFLGRLQTERDRDRVLDGLEGTLDGTAGAVDRGDLGRVLAAVEPRVFVMHDVHRAAAPVRFRTRWTLSYLRGPLTRPQISALSGAPEPQPPPVVPAPTSAPSNATSAPPVVPPEIPQRFVTGTGTIYRPMLHAVARVHHVSARHGIDRWESLRWLVPFDPEGNPLWDRARPAPDAARLEPEPSPGIGFASLPPSAARPRSHAGWAKRLADHLCRTRALVLWRCPALKLTSRLGESEPDFRIRVAQAARERRDAEVEALRRRFGTRLARAQARVRAAEERLDRERDDAGQQKAQAAVSLGSAVLGAIFGRPAGSIGRATTAARSAARTRRAGQDVQRAEEALTAAREELAALEREMEQELATVRDSSSGEAPALERVEVRPRKGDLEVEPLVLVWQPEGSP